MIEHETKVHCDVPNCEAAPLTLATPLTMRGLVAGRIIDSYILNEKWHIVDGHILCPACWQKHGAAR